MYLDRSGPKLNKFRLNSKHPLPPRQPLKFQLSPPKNVVQLFTAKLLRSCMVFVGVPSGASEVGF